MLIEGKRTETLSASVSWYPGRNQLVRNLEVAQAIAGGEQFAVLVIAEELIPLPSQQVVDVSLPHISPQERQTLMGHDLGCVTWQQVCTAVDFSYASLPDTVAEWITGR